MINQLTEKRITCPHCGHHLSTTIDTTSGDQDYYDECPACCMEIHYHMQIDDYRKKVQLTVDCDDEQIF